MDLLGVNPAIDLGDREMHVYSRNEPLPPSYLGADAHVVNSIYTAGCEINGTVINSVLSENVTIGSGAVVRNSVIMRGTVVGDGATVDYGIVDENVKIGKNAVVGDEKSDKTRIALIGRGTVIADGARVASGEIVEKNRRERYENRRNSIFQYPRQRSKRTYFGTYACVRSVRRKVPPYRLRSLEYGKQRDLRRRRYHQV